ncbi:DUF4169 family protein [Roseovarius sp. BRH_c41]|jgi:hypothetical protein|uniref:DUF4169 family protein n=1 Tax=Roseovarius sp. BRH_c41 TaxID=1629709 RepID=UPI0005F0DD37|nr:DUF4169 family protein [Roseovarius sp. BRH_c41]KJS44313.1 MAG: amidase [Roseovarius sp. BRH_c41]
MSEGPVNLNRVRKQKARAADKARAEENAARFGRTKAQKAIEQAQADKARVALDDHRLDKD